MIMTSNVSKIWGRRINLGTIFIGAASSTIWVLEVNCTKVNKRGQAPIVDFIKQLLNIIGFLFICYRFCG
ncbi:MAG: hypothetical protein K0S08_1127 [Gammaproteobacteria bacterium]|nr:hypothetical protein [Gammaproteobacteria bacterium]